MEPAWQAGAAPTATSVYGQSWLPEGGPSNLTSVCKLERATPPPEIAALGEGPWKAVGEVSYANGQTGFVWTAPNGTTAAHRKFIKRTNGPRSKGPRN